MMTSLGKPKGATLSAFPHFAWTRRFRLFVLTLLVALVAPLAARAGLLAGYGVAEMSPPKGTPSAGYGGRGGRPMLGSHDPLLCTALAFDNGERKIVFCGADHLGMTFDMIQEAIAQVHADPELAAWEVYVGSSHTHAGGGGFMNIPGVGFILAGKFSPEARQVYIDATAKAVIAACKGLQPAKAGIGYGHAPGMNHFRSSWPKNVTPCDDVAVIKVTKADGSPLACLFNFAAHPTVLGDKNLYYSADWVGYARTRIEEATGGKAVFFQGAQADVSPGPPAGGKDGFDSCDLMGKAMAGIVKKAWDGIKESDTLKIRTLKEAYAVEPKPNSAGMLVKMGARGAELNLVVLNEVHAFVTIPGELSTIYDAELKRFGAFLGYEHVSIFGLTNDAHGYIITPEAWRHKTYESSLSFGGQMYGELIENKARAMLDALTPVNSPDGVIPSELLSGQAGQ